MREDFKKHSYASVAVIEYQTPELVAIETISITREACDLSGAWILKSTEKQTIENLLKDKLVIVLESNQDIKKLLGDFSKRQVFIADFLSEAKSEASSATQLYEEFKVTNAKEYADYMKISPSERKLIPKVTKKNLVEPTFSRWPSQLDLSDAESELENLGKLSRIDGTPNEMRKVLAASRLIQMLVYMWKSDESERLNRQYVKELNAIDTILPISWLEKIA